MQYRYYHPNWPLSLVRRRAVRRIKERKNSPVIEPLKNRFQLIAKFRPPWPGIHSHPVRNQSDFLELAPWRWLILLYSVSWLLVLLTFHKRSSRSETDVSRVFIIVTLFAVTLYGGKRNRESPSWAISYTCPDLVAFMIAWIFCAHWETKTTRMLLYRPPCVSSVSCRWFWCWSASLSRFSQVQ